MPVVFPRTKTRQQAQDSRRFDQQSFEGAQNSDTPATKIGPADLAGIMNAVCFATGYCEGHYGAILGSPEPLPGTGVIHDIKQHPVTGRWLLHRDGKIYLTPGRPLLGWSEVGVIGPDGSLEATGTYTDGKVTMSGAAASYISNMVLVGVDPGDTVYLQVEADSGQFKVRVYSDVGMTVLIASGAISDATVLPAPVPLAQSGGSGVSGTVSMDVNPTGAVRMGSGVVSTRTVEFTLRGLTTDNTDDFTLYATVENDGGNVKFSLSDAHEVVAIGLVDAASVEGLVTEENDSGISGSFERSLSGSLPTGVFDVSDLVFTPTAAEDIDEASKIDYFRESGFMLFVRGDSPHNIFVDQNVNQYWFLSTTAGYSQQRLVDGNNGAYLYRYINTFARIVDENGEPAPGLNRITGNLQFEGPGNLIGDELDYGTYGADAEVDSGAGIDVELLSASGPPVSANAAAYITHVPLYRTRNVNAAAVASGTNPDEYVWVADVPIGELTYEDETSDAVLLARLDASGKADAGGGYRLPSRGWREMDRGIGAIRPDYMATAFPRENEVSYCDVAVLPRLIGFHNPLQRQILQDPVSEITATKEMFVYLCPSSNYTVVTGITTDLGQGMYYIPTFQNFERSSQTVGIKYGQRAFPVDDSSFIALCSDGSVRIYTGTSWGNPLDGLKVHKLTELAQAGAVIAFIRDVALMWYTEDIDGEVTTKCLRYGGGGQSGIGWTVIGRSGWPQPPVGGGAVAVWETDEGALRLMVVNDYGGTVMTVEDLPPLRQYDDDEVVPVGGFTGPVTTYITSLVLAGGEAADEFLINLTESSGVNYVIEVFQGETLVASATGLIADQPIVGGVLSEEGGSGITGIFSLSGYAAPNIYEGTYVVAGVAVVGVTPIPSPVKFRELTATTEAFMSSHKRSHVYMRFPYGKAAPLVTAKWYADSILKDTQAYVPQDGDIESYAFVNGRRIQLELTMATSGWQMTGYDTEYQTRDERAVNGPWNSNTAEIQKEIASNMISWVNGITAMLNRIGTPKTSYVGTAATRIAGPFTKIWGQLFPSATTFAKVASIGEYTIMFWAKNPTTGATALSVAPHALMVGATVGAGPFFADATTFDVGPFDYQLDTPCNDSLWHHYAVVRDSAGYAAYQDGVLIGDDADALGASLAVTSMRLGSAGGSQSLYDPRTYDEALSAEAVAYYYDHPEQLP